MHKSLGIVALLGFLTVTMLLPPPARGVTLHVLGFDEMVQQAAVIVQGQVTKMESFWGTGQNLARHAGVKESQAPARQSGPGARTARTTPETPLGVGTEGGRMLFTRVTLAVASSIKGTAGQTMEFIIAGGALDGRNVVIPGMPEFHSGGQYIVFLRSGHALSADPIVGVNQGFFQVVHDPESGQHVVLNANADYVLGIEEDRVVARRNPQALGQSGHARMQLTGPPVPDTPGVQSEVSQATARYWNSTEARLTAPGLVQAIHHALGR